MLRFCASRQDLNVEGLRYRHPRVQSVSSMHVLGGSTEHLQSSGAMIELRLSQRSTTSDRRNMQPVGVLARIEEISTSGLPRVTVYSHGETARGEESSGMFVCANCTTGSTHRTACMMPRNAFDQDKSTDRRSREASVASSETPQESKSRNSRSRVLTMRIMR